MNLVLPLVAFLFGWGVAPLAHANHFKKYFSLILARFLIPFVIIYNMVYYQAGNLSLMLFSFFSAIVVYACFVYFFKDRLIALCASYVNLAWLGFPFALVIFGPAISSAMIALYIGGSVFGNVWAVTAVSAEKQLLSTIVRKVLQSPPIIALLIAAILRLMGLHNWPEPHWFEQCYALIKVAMIFTGMAVLGIWLRDTHVTRTDLLHSIRVIIPKLVIGAVICSLAYFIVALPELKHFIGLMFFLFCLPPAANIVALETHYQGTGYSAKYIAAGTIVSMVVIVVYGFIWHFMV
ncbi:MAG: permease [Acinetobacter sp.]